MSLSQATAAAFGLSLLLLMGCGRAAAEPTALMAPKEWTPGKQTVSLKPATCALVNQALTEKFGSPGKPKAWKELPVNYGLAAADKGRKAGWRLQLGHDVFAAHCAGCHGFSGDGAGPEGKDLNPQPRDFRLGIFKWTMLKSRGYDLGSRRASRFDLKETLRIGIPGTSMPSFEHLSQDEIEAVVEYVRWLAIRGEIENYLATSIGYDAASVEKEYLDKLLDDGFWVSDEAWRHAELEESIARPKNPTPPSKDSIARGRELYLAEKNGCSKCHGDDGRGAIWPAGQPNRNKDRWGNIVIMGDLNTGILRGGDSPHDVYRRLTQTIPGTLMPRVTPEWTSEAETWDLVNYVMSLRPKNLDAEYKVARREPPEGLADPVLAVESASGDTGTSGKHTSNAAPIGWGELTGRFVFQGVPPEPVPLKVTKDRAVCGNEQFRQSVTVSGQKGLSDVVVFLSTPDVAIHPDLKEAPEEAELLEIIGCRFEPRMVLLRTGQPLELKNRDPITQNFSILPEGSDGSNGIVMTIPDGKSMIQRFKRQVAQIVPVTNTIRPWMQSYVFVRDTPYMALCDADGTFVIKQIPTGELTFQVTHEPPPSGSLRFAGWQKERKTVVIKPDVTTDLGEIEVSIVDAED